MKQPSIGIIGGGAWGLSLGHYYHQLNWLKGLYTHYQETVIDIQENQESSRLKDVHFAADFPISHSLEDIASADHLLLACTLKALPAHLKKLQNIIKKQNVILCCKGQNPNSFELPHQIAGNFIPNERIYLLSGPSFAADLARNKPVAVCLAGVDQHETQELASFLSSETLRIYATSDRNGVAIGGAYKNVLAIALGIGRSLQIGASAEAALITRGIVEIQRICVAQGGKVETIQGLSGAGDIILSCSNTQSRNFRLGMALGAGMNTLEASKDLGGIAEGQYTTQTLPELVKKYHLNLPIFEKVYAVVNAEISAKKAMQQLINRPGGQQE